MQQLDVPNSTQRARRTQRSKHRNAKVGAWKRQPTRSARASTGAGASLRRSLRDLRRASGNNTPGGANTSDARRRISTATRIANRRHRPPSGDLYRGMAQPTSLRQPVSVLAPARGGIAAARANRTINAQSQSRSIKRRSSSWHSRPAQPRRARAGRRRRVRHRSRRLHYRRPYGASNRRASASDTQHRTWDLKSQQRAQRLGGCLAASVGDSRCTPPSHHRSGGDWRLQQSANRPRHGQADRHQDAPHGTIHRHDYWDAPP